MLLCWHCDNQLREQTTAALAELARRNLINWLISSILSSLGYNNERELSLVNCAGGPFIQALLMQSRKGWPSVRFAYRMSRFYPYIEKVTLCRCPRQKAFCRRRSPSGHGCEIKAWSKSGSG
jgi:hypothetical protein